MTGRELIEKIHRACDGDESVLDRDIEVYCDGDDLIIDLDGVEYDGPGALLITGEVRES